MKTSLKALFTAIALMYHRIDAVDTNPWGICVSPENFEQQIQFLKVNFNVINSQDLINPSSTKNNKHNICITFDDGYADNYIHAKPILEKYNCAATFFIATSFINQTKPFWWDELELILLHSKKLPAYLCLNINEKDHEYKFDENELSTAQWLQHTKWNWYNEPPTKRCAAYMNIWEILRPLSYNEIEKQMCILREWSNYKIVGGKYRLPMNENQLKYLSVNKLFTIGLHTHSHTDLNGKAKHVQVKEIISCKVILRNKYNVQSNMLAYPYGLYDSNTIKAVKELQLAACFTTKPEIINAYKDLNRLGRFQVKDWDIETFKEHFNGWIKGANNNV